jgi:hypothetical protein
MKNNLILTNLAEQSTEDVERKLLTLIFERLGIEHKIEIGNAVFVCCLISVIDKVLQAVNK